VKISSNSMCSRWLVNSGNEFECARLQRLFR